MKTNKNEKDIYAISAYNKTAKSGDEFWTDSTPEKAIEQASGDGDDYEGWTVYKLVPVGKIRMSKATFEPNTKQ